MGLCKNYSIRCHYTQKIDEGKVFKFIEKYKLPVIALPLGDAILIERNSITLIGSSDAFIFDIDNVLIDTRKSYLESIIKTVEVYLTYGQIPFFSAGKGKLRKPLLTLEDI